jgi:hypothetical protein
VTVFPQMDGCLSTGNQAEARYIPTRGLAPPGLNTMSDVVSS